MFPQIRRGRRRPRHVADCPRPARPSSVRRCWPTSSTSRMSSCASWPPSRRSPVAPRWTATSWPRRSARAEPSARRPAARRWAQPSAHPQPAADGQGCPSAAGCSVTPRRPCCSPAPMTSRRHVSPGAAGVRLTAGPGTKREFRHGVVDPGAGRRGDRRGGRLRHPEAAVGRASPAASDPSTTGPSTSMAAAGPPRRSCAGWRSGARARAARARAGRPRATSTGGAPSSSASWTSPRRRWPRPTTWSSRSWRRAAPGRRSRRAHGMVVADHLELAGDYRTAHAIRRRSDGGEATLDELREGFQHYRALFSRLLDDAAGGDQDGDRRAARAPERERDPVRGREPVGPARSRSPGQRARRHARG